MHRYFQDKGEVKHLVRGDGKFTPDLIIEAAIKMGLCDAGIEVAKLVNEIVNNESLGGSLKVDISQTSELKDTDKEQEEVRDQTTVRGGRNFLIAIGVMALILAKSAPQFKRGKKPNCSQIAKKVQELATDLKIEDSELRSFNKTISDALSYVKDQLGLD